MQPLTSSSQRAVWIRWRASLPMPSLHLLPSRSFATWVYLVVTQRVRPMHTHAQTSYPFQQGGWLLQIRQLHGNKTGRRKEVAPFLARNQPLQLVVFAFSESSLLTEAPPTPSMYKYRPAYSSPGKNHTAASNPNKVPVRFSGDKLSFWCFLKSITIIVSRLIIESKLKVFRLLWG